MTALICFPVNWSLRSKPFSLGWKIVHPLGPAHLLVGDSSSSLAWVHPTFCLWLGVNINCIPPHSLKRPASTVNHAVALTFSSALRQLPNEAWFVVFREGPELSHLLSPLAVPSAWSDQPPSQPQVCTSFPARIPLCIS